MIYLSNFIFKNDSSLQDNNKYRNMKSINSKSFKQYQASSNKRSISPLLASNQQGGLQSNSNPKSAKKKIVGSSPYQRAMKQFQTYGKAERKKASNYLDGQSNQHNKFRIVTQPVDDRIMHLAQSNIFNSSLAIKAPKKIQAELVQSSAQIRLNLRQQNNSQSRSRQRIYSKTNADRDEGEKQYQMELERKQRSGEKSENRHRSRQASNQNPAQSQGKCKNCAKYAEELEYLHAHIKKIVKMKDLWKNGQITYEQVHDIFNSSKQQSTLLSGYPQLKSKAPQTPQQKVPQSHTSLHSGSRPHAHIPTPYKFADTLISQIRSSISDLITQIQSLSFIDYPKMLQMQIFKYQPTYNDLIDTHEIELKQLFGQLRNSIEGKVIEYDTYDSESENNYVKMIVRNLKARLSACLRENLELRICKSIYEKSQEISDQSEEYLRKVIEEVLQNYIEKPKKQKQVEKQKTKKKL